MSSDSSDGSNSHSKASDILNDNEDSDATLSACSSSNPDDYSLRGGGVGLHTHHTPSKGRQEGSGMARRVTRSSGRAGTRVRRTKGAAREGKKEERTGEMTVGGGRKRSRASQARRIVSKVC